MKRFLLIATILVAASVCDLNAITKSDTPERQGWDREVPLYGDVESVFITGYNLEDRFGEIVQGEIEWCTKYRFNTKGDVMDISYYNSDGSLKCKDIFKYDSSGKMIENALYNSDGSLDLNNIYEYDSSGKMMEYAYYNSDGSLKWKNIY